MSAYRLPWVLSQVAVTLRRGPTSASLPAAAVLHHQYAREYQLPLFRSLWNNKSSVSPGTSVAFSTQATGGGDDEEPLEGKPKKAKGKQDPRARPTVGNVGRKIHHRRLMLLSESGEELGTYHRADVIRMMDEKLLKLVVVNEKADPPVFRLMTGKQIHEEQMKLREKMKSKSGPIQVKEVTLSLGIGSGDLNTKLRQITSWLDKKHHVRVTLRGSNYRGSSDDDMQPLDKSLEEMLSKLDMPFGYASPLRVIKEGRAASCAIRPPSEKEKRAAMATSASAGTTASTASSASTSASRDTPPSSPTAEDGSVEKDTDSK